MILSLLLEKMTTYLGRFPVPKTYLGNDRLKMEDSEDRLPQTIHQFGSQRSVQRSPVAHMKALNALSSLPDPKIWIRILR